MKNNDRSGVISRKAALEVLLASWRGREPLDAAFAASPAFNALTDADRAFAYQLVMQSCRYRAGCEAVLAGLMERPLKPSKMAVRIILCMGMVQHFVMATPAHAVVNTSVELTKKVDKAFAGLVNAVLKKAIALPPGEFRAKAVSLYFPDWVNAALSGDDKDSLAVALLEEPALDILHKPEWQPPDGFGESLLPHHLRLPKGAGRIEHLPGFAEGQWWVQDIAASLPVRLLGDLKGRTVLDACAAPGGKTAQLCSLGAQVTAVDQSRDRLQRLRQNMQRLHFDPKVIEADLLAWQPQQPFDAVLLDAPCSATGTLRRNPDIAWLREPAEIQRLVAMQRRMLARTSGWVKPGGILIYAVCSLLPEEGELQIATFLTQADFVLEPIKAGEIGNYIQWLRSDGSLRPLPNSLMEKGGMDGFYVARLRRRS